MIAITSRVASLLTTVRRPFYSSSIYLLGKTVINSGSGFLFWIIAARLYTTGDVGLAAALISAIGFLGWLTSLGLDSAIIKYLPEKSENSVGLTNSCLTIWNVASVVGGIGFLIVVPFWLPSLAFIGHSAFGIVIFIATLVASGVGAFVDFAVIVQRRSKLLFIRTALQAALKLVLLAAVAVVGGKAIGLFASFGLATIITAVVALWLFLPKALPGFRPRLTVRHMNLGVARYSAANFLSSGLQVAPLQLVPLIVLNVLGTRASAYSYIGWRTAMPLFAVAEAAAVALFAEGSRRDESLATNVMRGVKLTALLLLPAVLIVVVGADKILLLFGGSYSREAATVLRVLAIATIPDAVIEIYLAINRIERSLWSAGSHARGSRNRDARWGVSIVALNGHRRAGGGLARQPGAHRGRRASSHRAAGALGRKPFAGVSNWTDRHCGRAAGAGMRIAVTTPRYHPHRGGVETHARAIAEWMVEAGIEVEVFTTDPDGNLPSVERISGVTVRRFRVWAPHDAYYVSAPHFLALARRVTDFDLVHAHSYQSLTCLNGALAAAWRRPFVFTPHYHGQGETRTRNLVHVPWRVVGAALFRQATRVICVSSAELARLHLRFPYARAVVIPNGVQVDRLRAARAASRSGREASLILFVGRLERYKNVDRLVECAAHLPETFRVVIVGDGPHKQNLLDTVKRRDLGGRVQIMSAVSDDELGRLYQTCDVCVNLSGSEAFGITLLEGLAVGKPVVANDIPAFREVGAISPLIRLVDLKALDNAELAEVISSARGCSSQPLDLSEFTWDSVARRTLDVYRDVLSGSAA